MSITSRPQIYHRKHGITTKISVDGMDLTKCTGLSVVAIDPDSFHTVVGSALIGKYVEKFFYNPNENTVLSVNANSVFLNLDSKIRKVGIYRIYLKIYTKGNIITTKPFAIMAR